MGFWAKILGALPKKHQAAACISEDRYWTVDETGDIVRFFGALRHLQPYIKVLLFEGADEHQLRDYLSARRAEKILRISAGTIWPRPDFHHMPLTDENLSGLIHLIEDKRLFYVASHIHGYRDDDVILQWYDARAASIEISGIVPEENVAAFAAEIGVKYQLIDESRS